MGDGSELHSDGQGFRVVGSGRRLVHAPGLVLAGLDHDGCGLQPGCVEESIAHYGTPAIMNTDQGSQFSSQRFTNLLKEQRMQISMDGKGSWRGSVFVEHLWRSVKYEEVYLRGYDSASATKAGLERYFRFYNNRRPHSSLDGRMPDQVYFRSLSFAKAA